jgi:hypothetical protein
MGLKPVFWRLFAILPFASGCNGTQDPAKETKELEQRFVGFVSAVRQMNIDSIQAYTYPKLFTLITLTESRESMQQSYTFFKNNARLDSVKTDTIFPIHVIGDGKYAMAAYSMLISIPSDSVETDDKNNSSRPPVDTAKITHSTGTEHYPAPSSTLLATLIRNNNLGVDITRYEEKNGMMILQFRVTAVAVKDEFADKWSFFTVTGDQELLNKLFPKKVLERLAADQYEP